MTITDNSLGRLIGPHIVRRGAKLVSREGWVWEWEWLGASRVAASWQRRGDRASSESISSFE